MIRNIIFDVGKVLVSYEPDAYMQRLGISKEKQKKINDRGTVPVCHGMDSRSEGKRISCVYPFQL